MRFDTNGSGIDRHRMHFRCPLSRAKPVSRIVCTFLAAASLACAGPASSAPKVLDLPEEPYLLSGINTAVFRRHALLTLGSSQLITYFTQNGQLALVQRSLENDRIERTLLWPDALPAAMLGDGHQAINMGYTADGHVHLFWGCHDTPHPRYLKLRWPELTECPAPDFPLSFATARLSYPQFYEYGGGLMLSFRRDSRSDPANPYDHCLVTYDIQSGKWIPLQTPWLVFPPVPQLAYLNNLGCSGHTIAAAYTVRRYDLMDTTDPHMLVMNDSLRFIWSDNAGKSWRGTTEKQLAMPLQVTDVTVDLPISPDQNLINQGGGWLTPDRKYHIGYFRNDPSGVPQIYLSSLCLSDDKVETEQVTQRTEAFALRGRGTQVWPISRPAVCALDSTLWLIFREGDRLLAARHRDGQPGWQFTELYRGTLGNYEPILDYTRLADGILSLYVQPSWQGTDDHLHQGPARGHAFLLEFTAQELRTRSIP